MILFYNVLYVYACKIGVEKFGGCWWLFSWLGQSNPVAWHPRCVCDCPNESTGPLFQLWSIQRVTKDNLLILSLTVLRMGNREAYCCRHFVVNRYKALLANRLALCYDS